MEPTAITSTVLLCGHCNKSGQLSRCARRKLMRYCNRSHEAAYYPSHKSACNRVFKAQKLVNEEELKLRSESGNGSVPANVFEDAV